MDKKSVLKFIVATVLIVLLACVAINGLNIGRYQIVPLGSAIKQGLDLKGGAYVIYEVEDSNKIEDLDKKLSGAIGVLRNRLDDKGYTEAVIVKQGTNRIRVEIPDIEDPDSVLSLIGKTANLEFIGPEDDVILTGKDIKSAEPAYTDTREPIVSLELNSAGADKFEEATEKYKGQVIRIVLDGVDISTPNVREKITGGRASIEGMAGIDEAAELASLIRSGALPVPLKNVEIRSVGATLGANALDMSIKAGIIGVLLVFLFMLIFYRLPGLVADIALILYMVLVLFVLALVNVQLTLPGIAGLILSIGMAVDANVIIFERLKDELKTGKTLRSSVDAAFSKAFSAILDGNITTLIAAVVLYSFGTGPIKGFAITLGVGIITSMFTAVFVTRLLLKLLMKMNLTGNLKMYGLRGDLGEDS